jgi:hypothetical protein
MADPLPNINIQLENDDLGQVFKDKINALINALNENRTEFNSQLAAETTAGQNAAIAVQKAAEAVAAAIEANNTVAGTHIHEINGVNGLQAALDALEIKTTRAKRLALAGI